MELILRKPLTFLKENNWTNYTEQMTIDDVAVDDDNDEYNDYIHIVMCNK